MPFLIVAALLAVVQTAPPVPRQTANDAAHARKNVRQQPASKEHNSTQSPSTSNAEQTPRHDAATTGQTDDNQQHSIVVSKLPPVTIGSPKRDWADWGTWGFNLLLVMVGGLQVALLYWTLRFVRRQATEMHKQRILIRRQWKAMQEQALAARQAIAVVIGKEKPRISITVDDLAPTLGVQTIKYELTCSGLTPAYISKSGVVAQISNSETPISKDSVFIPQMYKLPPIIKPPEMPQWQGTAFIFPELTLTQDQVDQIASGKKFVHFWGFIEYRDVFYDITGKDRQTRFRLVWNFFPAQAFYGESKPTHGYWKQIGEQEDNAET